MHGDIRYVGAWRRNDPQIERDAVAMWNEMRILPPNVRPEDRARELVSVAYAGDRIVGITTATLQTYQPVRQRFAFIRILMRPEAEKSGVSVPLTVACREELREWSVANPQEQVAGYAAIITAAGYGAKPVLPAGLTVVGYTPDGHQIRLYWWDHFRLPV
jgi:hypothetical protein